MEELRHAEGKTVAEVAAYLEYYPVNVSCFTSVWLCISATVPGCVGVSQLHFFSQISCLHSRGEGKKSKAIYSPIRQYIDIE